MSDYLCINYCCMSCGYTWDDTIPLGAMAGACQCPNCEETVQGSMDSSTTKDTEGSAVGRTTTAQGP